MVLFANRYQENQVGGRGFLGLATLVVGNWRPAGVAAGAGLFGYFQGITLRTNPEQLVLALLLVGVARPGRRRAVLGACAGSGRRCSSAGIVSPSPAAGCTSSPTGRTTSSCTSRRTS